MAWAGGEVTLEGKLEVVHFDYFAAHSSRDEYRLKTQDGKRLALHFQGRTPELEPNARLRVRGHRDGNSLTVASSDAPTSDVQVLSQPAAVPAINQKKVAVIVFNWQNDQRQPRLSS
jgi:hypothetical protein